MPIHKINSETQCNITSTMRSPEHPLNFEAIKQLLNGCPWPLSRYVLSYPPYRWERWLRRYSDLPAWGLHDWASMPTGSGGINIPSNAQQWGQGLEQINLYQVPSLPHTLFLV